ncbi:hypothetical protein CBF17_015770 [Pantoea agglomerans]|nr:hypothetical protein CBF17_015770 [Pantoea agglomerans]
MHLCWLRSLTRITYLSKLIGIRSLAASMQPEIHWVYPPRTRRHADMPAARAFRSLINSVRKPRRGT